MQSMNRQLNLPQIQKILHEFEKQSEIMDMKEEMINEHIDDAMEDEGDEEESDAVVSQVLDELGLQLNDALSGLPQVKSIAAKSLIGFDVYFFSGVWIVVRGRFKATTSGRNGSRCIRRWRCHWWWNRRWRRKCQFTCFRCGRRFTGST